MKIGYLMQVGEEIRKPPYNGPANHVRQVFDKLTKRGHQIRILFRLDGVIWKSDDLENYSPVFVRSSDQGVLRIFERVIRRVQSTLKLPYFGFFESLRFALACRQELVACDIYLERMSWMSYGGALIKKASGIPLVLEYNGNPLADLEAKSLAPRGLQRFIAMKTMRWAIQAATHVVATGEGWRKSCLGTWGVNPEKASVIENGTDLIPILAREKLRNFRIADNREESVSLIYLGGFYKWHGFDILSRAMKKIMDRGAKVTLTLIGAGDGFQDAQELTQELKLGDVVCFRGRLPAEEYAPLLADAEIGLSPYCGWEEYSGLKIFDYKAAGLACIASGEDGQPATLRHGYTGWVVPPCDGDALVEAILTLSGDPSLRRKIGQEARLEAERLHTWENTVEQLENVMIACQTR